MGKGIVACYYRDYGFSNLFPEKERRAWRGLTYQNKKKNAKYEREENRNTICN